MPTLVDIKNLKLPSSSDGSKKELMDKLRNFLRDSKNAFTRLVGSTSKPGLYPESFEKFIPDAGSPTFKNEENKVPLYFVLEVKWMGFVHFEFSQEFVFRCLRL